MSIIDKVVAAVTPPERRDPAQGSDEGACGGGQGRLVEHGA